MSFAQVIREVSWERRAASGAPSPRPSPRGSEREERAQVGDEPVRVGERVGVERRNRVVADEIGIGHPDDAARSGHSADERGCLRAFLLPSPWRERQLPAARDAKGA